MAPDPLHVVSHIVLDFSQLQLCGIFVAPSTHVISSTPCKATLVVSQETFRLTCDVSLKNQFSPAVITVILIDHQGHILHGITHCFWCLSILNRRSAGFTRGLHLAFTLSLPSIIYESPILLPD